MRPLFITLVIGILSHLSNAQSTEDDGMFTSSVDLERLLSTEAELVKSLKDYVKLEELRIVKLKQHVAMYEDIQSRAESDVEKYVGNPLNSYLLIKKLTSDWKEVKNLMATNLGETMFTNMTDSFQRPLKWPSEEDLSGAAIALTRLQETYKLDPSDLANGKLNGVKYGPSLSSHDCFELGRQHYNNADYDHTIQWMEEAVNRLDDEIIGEQTVARADILEYIGFSYYTKGDIKQALKYTNELLAVQPDHARAVGNKVYYEDALKKAEDSKQKKGDDGQDEIVADPEYTVTEMDKADSEHAIYQKLCRGETVKPLLRQSELKCRYYHGRHHHPFLIMAPYKMEIVHLDPKIVIFYNVMPESETATVKYMATPRFKRATVQNYKTGDLETANYRISKTAWLKRDEHRHIEQIYQRVGEVTGLNMNSSEELQISNYGIGGHYEPHFDFARKEETNAFASLGTGNRIATWLFYISDVELGGATVFPDLGLTLWPKKGSAAFWYNLYKNGEGDVRTRHAACPVLAGTKWVSNFWIHERGQEFVRPCSTSPAK